MAYWTQLEHCTYSDLASLPPFSCACECTLQNWNVKSILLPAKWSKLCLNAFWKTLRMLLSISETEFCKKSQKFNFSYLAFTQKCFQAIRLYNLKVGKNLYCILNRFFETNMGNPDFNFSTRSFLTKCHCTIMMWAKNMFNKNTMKELQLQWESE